MTAGEMKNRTKQFALRIVRLSLALPKTREADVLGRQMLKSGTSVGANYREAVRASSRRHFVTNLEICLREADETIYWLELLAEAEIISAQRLGDLINECNQLIAIMTASVRTTKRKSPTPQKRTESAKRAAAAPHSKSKILIHKL